MERIREYGGEDILPDPGTLDGISERDISDGYDISGVVSGCTS